MKFITNISNEMKNSLKKNLDNKLFDQVLGGTDGYANFKPTWNINFKMNRTLTRQIDGRIRLQLYRFI